MTTANRINPLNQSQIPVTMSLMQSAASGQKWQSDPTVQDIRNAFILGWSLVELRSRVQIAALDDNKLPPEAKNGTPKPSLSTADPVNLVIENNDRLLRASRMRTVFNSIVTLQSAKSLNGISHETRTLYDPPDETDLPYLFPKEKENDYANIGILGTDQDNKPILADFRLFEITRRALNCLTLLLVKPHDSLIPKKIESDQSRLISAILEAVAREEQSHKDQPSQSTVYSLATTTVQACNQYKTKSEVSSSIDKIPLSSRSDHGKAITTLSVITIRLLQAWDGYLRERLTAEGVGTNNLLTLVAYEVGRNMASISWNTSVNTILLENQKKEMGEKLYEAWKATFTDSNLIQMLHQITALGIVFDEAYHRPNGKPQALMTDNLLDDLLLRPDPALPSQVLQAVRQSIEYWQRTVLWLGTDVNGAKHKDRLKSVDWRSCRNALIKQSGIWFNLMTGLQDLRGFTAEGITHQILDPALCDLRNLAQRDLPAATQQAAQQIKNLSGAAKEELNQLLNTVKPWLWGVIGLSVLAIILLIGYILFTGKAEAVTGIFTSLITAALGALGIKQSSERKTQGEAQLDTKIESQSDALQATLSGLGSGLVNIASNTLGQTGTFLVKAYENGLLRIQIELQLLNFSVAITHPLIEFIVRQFAVEGKGDKKDNLDFLTVIWDTADREAQLRRVVTAAFGPISILLGAPQSNAAGLPQSNSSK